MKILCILLIISYILFSIYLYVLMCVSIKYDVEINTSFSSVGYNIIHGIPRAYLKALIACSIAIIVSFITKRSWIFIISLCYVFLCCILLQVFYNHALVATCRYIDNGNSVVFLRDMRVSISLYIKTFLVSSFFITSTTIIHFITSRRKVHARKAPNVAARNSNSPKAASAEANNNAQMSRQQ